MFVVLYRWRLKPGMERQFAENWSAITSHYVEHCGSLGSRLHHGADGVYYGYAQWPSSLTREKAMLDVRLELVRLHMKEAIDESFPETILEIVEDFLKTPTPSE